MAQTFWLAVVLACAVPCSAYAQRFALPVDIEQGLVFGAADPRTPYLFAVRMVPSLDVERARFGLVLAPVYRNPAWDVAVGVNAAWFVATSGKESGLRLVVQGEYLLHQQIARVSVGAVAELLGLLRIGLWPAFDLDARRAELCLSIGADVMSWARLLSGSKR
jgi:hypothetical protein